MIRRLFAFFPRKARERMIELSQTRDRGKEEGMEGWGQPCVMGNGFSEVQDGDGAGGGRGKQLHRSTAPPSNSLMDNISGEFALVINGHSLV